MILHAGCVARPAGDCWRGVLVRGPSGAGKSDLALRLLGRGWSLVADDRAMVWAAAGALYARAPDALAGRLELRGVDVFRTPFRRFARLALLVEAAPATAVLERIPEPETEVLAGVSLPLVRLHALEASAPVKLELAWARATGVADGLARPGSVF